MSPTASAPYLMYGRYRIHSDVLTWKSLPNFLPFYQENPLVICGFPLQIGRNEQLKTVLVNSRLDKLWNKLSSFMSFKTMALMRCHSNIVWWRHRLLRPSTPIGHGKNWSKWWWRHQMKTFSALLAICAGNSPASDEFPAQRPVTELWWILWSVSK